MENIYASLEKKHTIQYKRKNAETNGKNITIKALDKLISYTTFIQFAYKIIIHKYKDNSTNVPTT